MSRTPTGSLVLGRRVVVCALVALVVHLGGTANAYWSAPGVGTADVATAAAVPVTLEPATPVASLFPGGTSDVVLTVTNPNASPVHLASLVLDTTQGTGGFAVDAGHTGCDVVAFGFLDQSNGGTGWTVPARDGSEDGTLSVTLADALSMSTAAADACQGVVATVYLRAA